MGLIFEARGARKTIRPKCSLSSHAPPIPPPCSDRSGGVPGCLPILPCRRRLPFSAEIMQASALTAQKSARIRRISHPLGPYFFHVPSMDPFRISADCGIADFDPSLVADDFLASLDIAAVNLACANGLPGAGALDIPACLDKIDDWSERVRQATSRNYDRFIREPHLFDGSLGKFYMSVLCSTLQRECGVRYNPERANDPGDARDSADRFIHGITHGAGGTCASLPVLYAAVGRRLGYPLRIVQGARHLFLRWDERESQSPLARDRFNIEATATGFVAHPDRFYEHWPFPHPDPDVDPRHYLRSLTPREELASFLCIRSIVLMDNGQFVQAIQPAAWARQLAPGDYSIKVHLEMTMLLALGILDEKPAWMDEHPVIRPDGVAWSRYWWPRPLENRELLPAARLPSQILGRILPQSGPSPEFGDMADALYERTNLYADEGYITQVHHAAIAEQNAAKALLHNTMVRARWQAIMEETSQLNRENLARQKELLRGAPLTNPTPGIAGPILSPHAHQPGGAPPIAGMPVPPRIPQPIPLGVHASIAASCQFQFGRPGLEPFATSIPGMPTFPQPAHLGPAFLFRGTVAPPSKCLR